jgi:hypothetical protein
MHNLISKWVSSTAKLKAAFLFALEHLQNQLLKYGENVSPAKLFAVKIVDQKNYFENDYVKL